MLNTKRVEKKTNYLLLSAFLVGTVLVTGGSSATILIASADDSGTGGEGTGGS